jgi:glutamine amidotransferase
MCRHLGWLGRPRTLAALVAEPEHGLLRQSWQPRRQRHGTMNADGWGVGWWSDGLDEPARWRSDKPLWSDQSFASVAPHVRSRCVLAAVRSATTGMPADATAAAPFTAGRWLLSHNGVVDRDLLGPQPGAESLCDSAQLAALVLRTPAEVGRIVAEVGSRAPGARLNLLLADGEQLFATTWGDTLAVLTDDDGIVVASEPYDDDPRWTDVPDRSLLHVTTDGLRTERLD